MKRLILLAALSAAGEEIVWEARPGFRDFGSFVLANDVLLTGNITGKGGTFAFDAKTGKLLWRAAGQMRNGPATDGRAGFTVNFVTGETSRLSAFDLKSGKVLWSAEGPNFSSSTDLLVDGGRLYLVSEDGKARAFDAATGRVIWAYAYSPGRGNCPTSAASSDGFVYFGGGEHAHNTSQGVFLSAVDAATGTALWRFAAKPDSSSRTGECVTAPAVSGGIVAVASSNVLYGLDAKTGAVRWKQEVRKQVEGRERRRTLAPPLIAGGRVYSIVEEGLAGWGLMDGRQEFEFAGNFPAEEQERRLAAAGGLLYFTANFEQAKSEGNRQGYLYALDPAAGQVKWKHRVNRPSKYESEAKWSTHHFLVAGDGVYYETAMLLAKMRP